MAYRFLNTDTDLTVALRRIAQSELGAAVAHLRDDKPPPASGVHDLRKRIKKVRGLLRLLRPGFAEFDAENAALRDTAQALSGLRDAEVRLATFDRLAGKPRPRNLSKLHDHLLAEREAAHHIHTDISPPRAELTALIRRAADWRIEGNDREVLHQGLTATRRAGIARMKAAARHLGVEEIHDWRKRAKDLWYQSRLLAPLWPQMLDPLAAALSDLTEDLGDHHDIAVLREMLHSVPPGTLSPVAMVDLHTRGTETQAEIETRAFAAGRRIYAGKPSAVADQWIDWWKAWRG
ncbi:CHAD domain-containing protein [Tabrizicola sp. J26]|uniref:CHAD domain-containing protein n=1 Tax=Alitabrizicola rongguiensis TaxID=2909234 RepID=UPI001F371D13|nr:CHAD domain-containing protein [Tabrizicola rongguiensis]MCF1707342.1 CHAD domain-containing protein [Tabrizicola rongguiensis]